jgi:hypothetical protein
MLLQCHPVVCLLAADPLLMWVMSLSLVALMTILMF